MMEMIWIINKKKILNNAKAKWSVKVEEMIANTDQWFINEDGDIVLIYPEADNIDNVQNEEDEDVKKMELNKEEFEDTNLSKDNINVIDGKEKGVTDNENVYVVHDDDNKQMIKEKDDDQNNNDNDYEQQTLIINNSNDSFNDNDNDKTDEKVKKTDNFFNSFRIF